MGEQSTDIQMLLLFSSLKLRQRYTARENTFFFKSETSLGSLVQRHAPSERLNKQSEHLVKQLTTLSTSQRHINVNFP